MIRRRDVYRAFGVSSWTRLRVWWTTRDYRRAKAEADAIRAAFARQVERDREELVRRALGEEPP